MKNILLKYLWLIPTLYVSYEFGNKIFEIIKDNSEAISIISVIKPLTNFANFLSYFIGYFDLLIAVLLIIIPMFKLTQKYSKYLFLWTALWVFVPSSLRYFGGVADFEIIQVLSISLSALLGYFLLKRYN